MSAFQYIALDETGKRKKGVIESDSARSARSMLRMQNLSPLKLTPVHQKESPQKTWHLSWRKRISVADLAALTRQMATLLNAGIPIDEVLTAVTEQTEKSIIKSIFLGVRSKVLEGHTLADSMDTFPNAFPKLYRTSIRAGETSGKLDIILLKLAEFIERQYQVRQKVRQALLYPGVMMSLSIAIIIFLLTNVVPKIITVFTDTHQILPLPTVLLINTTHFIQHNAWFLLITVILLAYLLKTALLRSPFRRKIDHLLLKLPIVGKAIKTINTARFSRTLGILTAAGVPVLSAINAATQLVTSRPIIESLLIAEKQVAEGQYIHEALKKTGYFSPIFIHLIASGASSDQLGLMLEKAAIYLENDTEALIKNVLILFEPCMILIMGGIVLFIVLAIMLPIFSLDQMGGPL